jgi:SOUL heme-binding protein
MWLARSVRTEDNVRKSWEPMDEPEQYSKQIPEKRERRWRRPYWITGIFGLVVIAGSAAGPIMSRVEQPEYKIEAFDGAIEVRSYGPMIAAEAVVEGERKAALNEGFRLIAAYIFGANNPNAKIGMTAPVQQPKQTIAMTAPVTQQEAGASWTVRFIMPKTWTMETLPTPKDARVSIRPVPAHRFIAIAFSGLATSEAIEKHTVELGRFAADHQLVTTGEPMLAFYNPPWTLPFFRRNEIMLKL